MKTPAWKKIEKNIEADNWVAARKLIREELKRDPKDHWLLGRLALTYYEQRKYDRALYWNVMALQEAPYCPLLIWDYAGTLAMLDRNDEALILYRWLLSWGEEQLAYGECGEGIRRARALIADCHYRIACIWHEKRQWKRAAVELGEYLTMRRSGHGSIYSLRQVKAEYEEVRAKVRR
jgi:tetratricopeptide (TPR) repeat protein